MSGIYCVKCLVNNKMYIGSCENFENRKGDHFNTLRNNRHWNKDLQKDYNKFGKDNFVFEILEEIEYNNDKLIELENKYIIKFNSKQNGYNKRLAKRNTKQQHKKQSNALKGYKHTEETKNKIREYAQNNIENKRKLTLNECRKIKQKLLENTEEKWKDKELRIAIEMNTSYNQVFKIKHGLHWSCKELGGGYKNWINSI